VIAEAIRSRLGQTARGSTYVAPKLVREFKANPSAARRIAAYGDPKFEQWNRAKAYTQRMSDKGELRPRSNRKA
jgi:hypothetical protein